jgi:HK97 family phage major capsid protein
MPETNQVAEVVGKIDAIGKRLDDAATKSEVTTLQNDVQALAKSVNDLTAKITVKDAGDDLGVGRRYQSVKALKDDREAYRFGMAFIAAIAKDVGGDKVVNPKLAEKAVQYVKDHGVLSDYVGKAQVEGTNTLGGFLVPDELSNRMIDLREQYGVGRQLAYIEPMSSDTKSVNREIGDLTVYPLGEGTAITTSDATWDRISLVAKKWGTLTKISSELNEDAIINLGDKLASKISYAFASKEDDCYFNGDGTSTYQGITGLRVKLKDINGVDEGGGLILQTGNDFAAITLTDFHELIGLLPQYADTPNVKFVCHRTFWAQVMCRLAYAAGGVSKADIASAGDKTFLGYPVVISQKFPSSDTASVVYCTLGDHSQATTIGDRRGTQVAFDSSRYFDTDEIAVRGLTRWDMNVHNVGTSTAAGSVVGLMSSAS